MALRFDNWKVVFSEQRVEGTFRIRAEPYVALRVDPGGQEQWSLRYTFYELDARKGRETASDEPS